MYKLQASAHDGDFSKARAKSSVLNRSTMENCLAKKIGMNLSFRDIARNLSISLGTAHGIYKHFQETGDVACNENST